MGKVFNALRKAETAAVNDAIPPTGEVAPDHASPVAPVAPEVSPAAELAGTSAAVATGTKSRASRQVKKAPPPLAASGWDERLVSALGAASVVGEEFRRLRTQILHPPADVKRARTILVTSAAPGEGKTFVCAGLAITLAQGVKEHALIIDCDLRRPAMAALFGLENDRGLADHLRNGVDLGSLIRKTGLDKLSLISSGPPPANPAELLGSEKLPAMISEVSNRYPERYVLVDSPPLLSAAETAILAKLVEGVVLVVRESRSRREDVIQLVNTIGPEKIIGVVFNAYRSNRLERGLAGSYGGSYYSTYGGEAR